jgi:hypothetical protein
MNKEQTILEKCKEVKEIIDECKTKDPLMNLEKIIIVLETVS